MRADVFTLLAISQNKKFIESNRQSKIIRRGFSKLFEPKYIKLINKPDFIEKLKGWNRVIFDMCNYNYLTDVYTVNKPKDIIDKRVSEENCDFIFANILPPGRH